MSKFYVYIHRRRDNNEIFYVGKGSANRAFSKLNRNNYWQNIVEKYGFIAEILFDNLEEDKAYLKEQELIKSYNPCANLTKGGEGGDTFSNLPDADKQRIRQEARDRALKPGSGIDKAAKIRKGKTKHTCEALRKMAYKNSKKLSGQGNPMYGKSHWYNKTEQEKQVIKKKTSESLKKTYALNPRTYEKVQCPHCGKIGGKPGMTRYHFNNCKFK